MINFRDDVLPLKNRLYRLALRITMHTGEAEDIVVGIYRMHYLKSAYYEVKLIDK